MTRFSSQSGAWWVVLAAMLAASALSGCASMGSSKEKPRDYVTLYQTGEYAAAFDAASKAATSLRGWDTEKASLIAGLSAHALDKNAEADRWLRPLLQSRDRTVLGKASATLGIIAQERREHDKAAELLTKAAENLAGDESARASLYAGDSLTALGRHDEALKAYTTALSKIHADSNLRAMIGQRLSAKPAARVAQASPGITSGTRSGAGYGLSTPRGLSGFSVQAGAFSNVNTANSEARRLSPLAPVRVVPIQKNGATLFAVRLGGFTTRSAAEILRRRVGAHARIVTSE